MATKSKGQRPAEKGQPGPSSSRLEKSRKLAQKRRETYKDLMTGIVESLPFSREVLGQLDYNSRLRLGLCFLKMKKLLEGPEEDSPKMIEAPPTDKAVVFQPGVLQELMIEAMDGFLMVLLSGGSIVYLSESIQKHLGLFQSEHMGTSLYDLVLEEDQGCVKLALSSAEVKAHTRIGTKRVSVPCSFFCRMRCSRNKVANTQSKSPGYKVVHTSGYFQLHGSEAFLVALVKPVTPPSILEIRMEGNMFVTHYALDMRCTFFDGRLNHLMGYRKEDLNGKLAFDFHHHDDTEATLECSKGVQARGEGMSGYYRMLTKTGQFVWLQTRATMMFDSHTGHPSYIVCMNFIINKEKGLQSLKALPAPVIETKTESFISEEKSKAHDPFPIPREDGKLVNPLSDVDPGNDLSPDGSLSLPSTSVAAGGKVGEVKIKLEVESPPDVPLPTEEPSSTTSPPPPSGGGSSDVSSQGHRGRFHDDTPLSGVTSGGGGSSSECVPDSTSAGEPSPEDGGCDQMVESGYNSRMQSISSYSWRRKKSSDSNSSGPGSTSASRDSHSEVFLGRSSESGVTPMQSYAGSSSTVLESDPSVYKEPVGQQLSTAAGSSSREAQERPSCQQRQSTSGEQSQPSSLHSSESHQELPQQRRQWVVESGVEPSRLARTLDHSGQRPQQPLTIQGGQQSQQPLTIQGGQQSQQPLAYQQQSQQPLTIQGGQQSQQPLAYQQQSQQPLTIQGGQQSQQPLTIQGGQQSQQPLAYQQQSQQPLTIQGGQQPQQPLAYQSGQQPQQPLTIQGGQQSQQPLAYQQQSQQPLTIQGGQQPQQPLAYQSGQQPQQPLTIQGGQQPQQPLAYQSGQQSQQPLAYQSGQQSQQPLAYQSGQQPQQPLAYQSGQQSQQPLAYQSGQQSQQPLAYQSGQQSQQPLAYQSGQQPQQPLAYQSGQQSQQPLAYQSGQQSQQPLAYQSGQQSQQPLAYRSGQQQQPQQTLAQQPKQQITYQSGQQQQPQQTLAYQNGQQQQPQQQITYQSGQQQQPQQQITYQSGQPQQPFTGYQQPLSHLVSHTHPGYVAQQPTMKQEMTSPLQYTGPPSRRYSNPTETGTGTAWQGNGIGMPQYQALQQSYQLHHSTTLPPPSIPQEQPLQQNLPIEGGGFVPAPPQNHTHQLHPQNFQAPPTNPPAQTLVPGGVNPQNLPLFSTVNPFPPHGGLGQGTSTGVLASNSLPLTHPQSFPAVPQATAVAVDTMATVGNVGHVTPDLVNLTGEDLQMLDFIDQLDNGPSF